MAFDLLFIIGLSVFERLFIDGPRDLIAPANPPASQEADNRKKKKDCEQTEELCDRIHEAHDRLKGLVHANAAVILPIVIG